MSLYRNGIPTDIAIGKLKPDQENFRFEPVGSEREALGLMIGNQEDMLYMLAEDIIVNGLNPSTPSIVCPSERNGEYTVLDGNRRLTSLLALMDPKLIPDSMPTLRKKFERIDKSRLGFTIEDNLRCVVFPDRDSALYWVRKQHLGPEQGKGLVEWTPIQKDRFEARTSGKTPKGYAAWEAAKVNADSDFLHLANRMEVEGGTYTNFTRVIESKKARAVLGIHDIDKSGRIRSDHEEKSRQMLRQIVRDLDSGLTVNALRKEPDIVKYAKSVRYRVTGEKPKSDNTNRKPKAKPKSLISLNSRLPISDNKIGAVYKELQTLKVQQCPLAAALLLRALIELSLERFIENDEAFSKLLGKTRDRDKLQYRLVKFFEYLEGGRPGVRRRLANFRKATIENKHVKLAEELNSYVHDRTFLPIPEELITTWGNIEKLMELIWLDTKPSTL